MEMSDSTPWDLFIQCFTQCPRCEAIVLNQQATRRGHVCLGEQDRRLGRAIKGGQQEKLRLLTDYETYQYAGLSKTMFGESFVRCSACNHVVFPWFWTHHQCTDRWNLVCS